MNILIVDDEKPICVGTARRINNMHLPYLEHIHTAFSGEQALDMLVKFQYHLLLTDIRMNKMDGLELIRRAKEVRPGIICVIITAYSEFDYAQRAIQLGVQDFLIKPCSATEMRNQLDKAATRVSIEEEKPVERDEFMVKVDNYCRNHLHENIDMSNVAAYLNLSYSYFSNVFHEQTGTTFSKYLISLKMKRASAMLLQGSRITEIAEELGYMNANNLTRAFTREFGMSPSKWLQSQDKK